MMIIYFINGLCFGGLGLAAYLQLRQGGDFALKKQLPWLAAFGFVSGATSWIDMFLASGNIQEYTQLLNVLRMITQPLSGLLLIIFAWGILKGPGPLPAWVIFLPGVLIVPVAYVITYAATTFITPSPIEIPIDIWSRYLLYLPGSILAGLGFLRQWHHQRKLGFYDVSNLMLGAGLAFLFEAVVLGLIVPAAPYGPASYYNYNRTVNNAFMGEQSGTYPANALIGWLDYQSVLNTTGMSIEIWRLLSALIVTFFVVKALDVFEASRKQRLSALQWERDRAQQTAFEAQIAARHTAESWTEALVSTSRRIAELEHVDDILLYIVGNTRQLLRADFVGLAILNQENSILELKCFATDGKTELMGNTTHEVANFEIQQAVRNSCSYRSLKGAQSEIFKEACFCPSQEARAIAAVPLRLEDTTIGALWMARSDDEQFSETDLIWLDSMADQIVISIQHGLMTSQLQSLSIVQERSRIAREMHDGLAQVLGYLNLEVQTLGSLLKQEKPDQLEIELEQMREAIKVANADVRENILSLRTTLAEDKSLISAMDEYLEEFGLQTGIETQFSNQIAKDPELSSVAEVQLVCILQEALTNVRKHAEASCVAVEITEENQDNAKQVLLHIADNGVGFKLAASKRSFGLQTMRERAESVGGKLFISSVKGKGTQVKCQLPCLQPERIPKQSVVIGD